MMQNLQCLPLAGKHHWRGSTQQVSLLAAPQRRLLRWNFSPRLPACTSDPVSMQAVVALHGGLP